MYLCCRCWSRAVVEAIGVVGDGAIGVVVVGVEVIGAGAIRVEAVGVGAVGLVGVTAMGAVPSVMERSVLLALLKLLSWEIFTLGLSVSEQ